MSGDAGLIVPSMVAVAVDVGKNVVALSATDAGRCRLFGPAEFTMTAPALRAVTARLVQVVPAGAVVKVGVEAAGHYHLPLLAGSAWPTGWQVLELNPAHVSEQRRVQGRRRVKTDAIDLEAITELLLAGQGVPVAGRDAVIIELAAQAAHRARRVAARAALKNQLLGQLDRSFPGLTLALPDVLGTKVGRLVAAEFADPARLAALGVTRFIRFAATRNLTVRQEMAGRLVQAARDALPAPGACQMVCVHDRLASIRSTQMTMIEEQVQDAGAEPEAARALVAELAEAGLLDRVMKGAESGELTLTGEGGFLPEMVKAVLERGLAAELTGHLGYEKGDPAGRGSANSRNGTTPKTLATEIGPVPLSVPRDRDGSFEPRLVPKGSRRAGGLDEMIISLYAGGMTVRDIQHHLARTIGTELSHDTISQITDAVSEEVKAWQARPLEELYPILYLDALVVKVILRTAATRSATRPRISPSASTWTASSTCWASGCRLPRAPSSGRGSAPSCATAASATC